MKLKLLGRLMGLWAFDFNQNRQHLSIPWYDGKSYFYHGKMVSPILVNFFSLNKMSSSMKFSPIFS